MPRRRPHAHDALLCEHCGYDLAGLTRTDNCPECGTPIAASLPEHRTGTPWQRGGRRELRRTLVEVSRHPQRVWSVVRNDANRSMELIFFTSLLSGAVMYPTAWVIVGPIAGLANDRGSFADALLVQVVDIPVVWAPSAVIGGAVVWVLTMVEIAGIAHFGRRRRWRTDWPMARVICAHASVMWIPGGVLTGLSAGVGYIVGLPVLPLIGFLLGMLLFETWVYLGFRAMRFANPPGAEQHLRDHAAPSPLGRGQSGGGEGSLPSPQPSDTALNPPEPSSPPPGSPSDA